MPTRRKIVLTTIGSLGDLHPFIAIGLALRARDFRVVMAVPHDQIGKCEAAGLEAVAVMPGFDVLCTELGLSEADAAARIMSDQTYLMNRVLMHWLPASADALDAVMDDAVAVVGAIFVFAAPIIAEKRRVPLVNVILQPMAMFSTHMPPRSPDFWMTKGAPVGVIGRRWNAAVYRVMRAVLRHRHAGPVNATRRVHGLAAMRDALLLDTPGVTDLTLCCYSPALAPPQPDTPANSITVGFPIFDSDSGASEGLPADLAAFLDAGPPPLVFTLGSFAIFSPGDFYREAAAAARLLGKRAILLTGTDRRDEAGPDIHVRAYAPHSLLFPRCCAIIHHGGIGSTGQALRAGRPQLVVPHMGDQHDNGWRVARMGVGQVLAKSRFSGAHAASAIRSLLADQTLNAEATRVGTIVRRECGAEASADAIVAMLASRTNDVGTGEYTRIDTTGPYQRWG